MTRPRIDIIGQNGNDGEVYAELDKLADAKKKHEHYFKDVAHLKEVDVYRVLDLFEVKDQVIGHAAKKLLVTGGRGGGKDMAQDVREAIETLERWERMQIENNAIKVSHES